MGWQSDWLYRLIFEQIAKIWETATREGAGPFGPPPNALLITETRDADWEHARCLGNPIRYWMYQGGEPECVPTVEVDTNPGQRQGMFYERGEVVFCIAADRNRVLFTYILGPRYGRGMILDVVGQGADGRLASSIASMLWVS
jgi:hypothetical protein